MCLVEIEAPELGGQLASFDREPEEVGRARFDRLRPSERDGVRAPFVQGRAGGPGREHRVAPPVGPDHRVTVDVAACAELGAARHDEGVRRELDAQAPRRGELDLDVESEAVPSALHRVEVRFGEARREREVEPAKARLEDEPAEIAELAVELERRVVARVGRRGHGPGVGASVERERDTGVPRFLRGAEIARERSGQDARVGARFGGFLLARVGRIRLTSEREERDERERASARHGPTSSSISSLPGSAAPLSIEVELHLDRVLAVARVVALAHADRAQPERAIQRERAAVAAPHLEEQTASAAPARVVEELGAELARDASAALGGVHHEIDQVDLVGRVPGEQEARGRGVARRGPPRAAPTHARARRADRASSRPQPGKLADPLGVASGGAVHGHDRANVYLTRARGK